jgi:hypothetical protein
MLGKVHLRTDFDWTAMVFAHACFPSIDLRSPSSSHHPMDVFPDNEASDRTLRVKTYTKFEADATRVTRCLPGKIAPNSGNLSRARGLGKAERLSHRRHRRAGKTGMAHGRPSS